MDLIAAGPGSPLALAIAGLVCAAAAANDLVGLTVVLYAGRALSTPDWRRSLLYSTYEACDCRAPGVAQRCARALGRANMNNFAAIRIVCNRAAGGVGPVAAAVLARLADGIAPLGVPPPGPRGLPSAGLLSVGEALLAAIRTGPAADVRVLRAADLTCDIAATCMADPEYRSFVAAALGARGSPPDVARAALGDV